MSKAWYFQLIAGLVIVVLSVETVEKPKIGHIGVCKLLILLHAKLVKSLFLGFFDSLAMYHRFWYH